MEIYLLLVINFFLSPARLFGGRSIAMEDEDEFIRKMFFVPLAYDESFCALKPSDREMNDIIRRSKGKQ